MDFFSLSLRTRYLSGLAFVFISGLVLMISAQLPSSNYKALWSLVTAAGFVHWGGTAFYLWWERRWYRYIIFVFSTAATLSYVEMSMRVWSEP